MSYPEPTYKERVDVEKLVEREDSGSLKKDYQEMFRQVSVELYRYLRNNTYHFHSSNEGQNGEYKKASALTPEGIVIHLFGEYSSHLARIPLHMQFELISFQTPVDKLKQELTDVVKDACKKVRGE